MISWCRCDHTGNNAGGEQIDAHLDGEPCCLRHHAGKRFNVSECILVSHILGYTPLSTPSRGSRDQAAELLAKLIMASLGHEGYSMS